MMRLLINEFDDGFEDMLRDHKAEIDGTKRHISVATGRLVYPCIKDMAEKAMSVCAGLKIDVYEIINEFFGEKITVSGLLTGQDIIKQLKDRVLGTMLYLPENLLRSGEDYLLDDVRVSDSERELETSVGIAKCDGREFVHELFGIEI
jgi:NifB/MoaA-like Fe-S oxidoreductase